MPQRWDTVDAWVAAMLMGSRQWQGCLMYNDDPPTERPSGSATGVCMLWVMEQCDSTPEWRSAWEQAWPPRRTCASTYSASKCRLHCPLSCLPAAGYARPVQYKTCGHTKGVVLWDGRMVGWLVHSVPKWPCHDTRSPSGVGSRGLSEIEDSQTQKAQSFIWVALPAAALPTVLRQVEHMQVSGQAGG